ncbi:NADPH-dependent FMN reductase [Leeia sp. TBRC 13508]|uniref:NADPH-dependent FMN reductase n=1 Tax=Leeia speluncae TaxID=2884804 RepID=A0ABS8DA49_9NEIS|nr:NADPH-dependent FMN reductase [Leeia speluncae]MCB6185037.1 NADPH-dependent FMN reductase [Leeia speluncae]
MSVLAILGSPSKQSKTGRLIERAEQLLTQQDIQLNTIRVHDFDAEKLLHADFSDPSIKAFQEAVKSADGLIIATPVYKAAYAGALKVLLDLIPEGGLEGKPVLPLASGGTPVHLLAVDYAIKPVLAALKAGHIQQGVFAVDKQIKVNDEGHVQLDEELDERITPAVLQFAEQVQKAHPHFKAPQGHQQKPSNLQICL